MGTPVHNFVWPFDDTDIYLLRQDSNDLLKDVPVIQQLHSHINEWYSVNFEFLTTDLLQRTDGARIADAIKQNIISINVCYDDCSLFAELIRTYLNKLSVYYPYRYHSPFLVDIVKDIVNFNRWLYCFMRSFFEQHVQFEDLLDEAKALNINS